VYNPTKARGLIAPRSGPGLRLLVPEMERIVVVPETERGEGQKSDKFRVMNVEHPASLKDELFNIAQDISVGATDDDPPVLEIEWFDEADGGQRMWLLLPASLTARIGPGWYKNEQHPVIVVRLHPKTAPWIVLESRLCSGKPRYALLYNKLLNRIVALSGMELPALHPNVGARTLRGTARQKPKERQADEALVRTMDSMTKIDPKLALVHSQQFRQSGLLERRPHEAKFPGKIDRRIPLAMPAEHFLAWFPDLVCDMYAHWRRENVDTSKAGSGPGWRVLTVGRGYLWVHYPVVWPYLPSARPVRPTQNATRGGPGLLSMQGEYWEQLAEGEAPRSDSKVELVGDRWHGVGLGHAFWFEVYAKGQSCEVRALCADIWSKEPGVAAHFEELCRVIIGEPAATSIAKAGTGAQVSSPWQSDLDRLGAELRERLPALFDKNGTDEVPVEKLNPDDKKLLGRCWNAAKADDWTFPQFEAQMNLKGHVFISRNTLESYAKMVGN
jgi:hypothetical protein